MLKMLPLFISLQQPVDMLIIFRDGTEASELVERSVCESLNEASGDPDKLLYAYSVAGLKQILMVLCRGDGDVE